MTVHQHIDSYVGFIVFAELLSRLHKTSLLQSAHLIYFDFYEDNSNLDKNIRMYHCGLTNNYTHLNIILSDIDVLI